VYASPLAAAASRTKFVVIPLGNRRPENLNELLRAGATQSGVELNDQQIQNLMRLSTRVQ
jgi:hypothetical protein